MILHRLKIEGFGSVVEPANFDLIRPGINIINTENGAGKTSLFSAIYWALFGETLRKDGKSAVSWEQVRTPEWRGTRVILLFSIGDIMYAVARHVKFKGTTQGVLGGDSLRVYANNVEIGTERGKENIQQELESLIGYNADSFLYGVIFGQRMKRFIEADSSEKRDFLEGLFNMSWFVDIQNKLAAAILQTKEKAQTLLMEHSKLEGESIGLDRNIASLAETSAKNKEELDAFMISFAEQEKQYPEAIKCQEESVVSINAELQKAFSILREDSETEECRILERELSSAQLAKDQTILIMEREKTSLQLHKENHDKLSDNCPTCGQEIKDKKSLEKTNLELKKAMTAATRVIHGCTSDLVESDKVIGELSEKLAEKRKQLSERYKENNESAQKISLDRDAATKALHELRNTWNAILSRKQSLEFWVNRSVDMQDLTARKLQITDRMAEIGKSIFECNTLLGQYEWWSTKAFHASGIKAYMFESLVSDLNAKVLKYASRFGLEIFFGVDLTKKSKPFITKVCINGMPDKDFNELSGGQQQRVNICMAFALYDLLSETIAPVNIFVLDEVFESLDAAGTEQVFEFIQDQVRNGKSVYVITHLAVHDSAMAKTIDVKFINNRTYYE